MTGTTRWFFLALAVLANSACTVFETWPGGSRSHTRQDPAPVIRVPPSSDSDRYGQESTRGPVDTQPDTVESVSQPTGPAGFLLDEASRQRRAGEFDAAARSIERAMRIQPGNPWLSLELGQVRLEQDNPAQAEQLAQRALAQAGGDRRLQSRCWALTAAARESRGDTAGAAVALDKAGE